MKTAEEIVTDSDLEEVFKNTNFGNKDKRDTVNKALLKAASGYANGHTIECIIQELGLVGKSHMKSGSLTKKGKEYFYEVFSRASLRSNAGEPDGVIVRSDFYSKDSQYFNDVVNGKEEYKLVYFSPQCEVKEVENIIELMINEHGNTYTIIETDSGNELFSLLSNKIEDAATIRKTFEKEGYIKSKPYPPVVSTLSEEKFYCKEWNNVGYVCEEQCSGCKKMDGPISEMEQAWNVWAKGRILFDKEGFMMAFFGGWRAKPLSSPNATGKQYYELINQIEDLCGSVNFSSHNQMKEAITGTMEIVEHLKSLLPVSGTENKKERLVSLKPHCNHCSDTGWIGEVEPCGWCNYEGTFKKVNHEQ